MCDEQTERDNDAYLKRTELSRRRLGKVGLGAGFMALLPGCASPQGSPDASVALTEQDVTITTPDGEADAYFVHPSEGAHAAVLVWPDILGLRPAFRAMGKRLAESGYAVLTVNPFYRQAKAPVVSPGETFADEAVRNRVMPLARALSPEIQVADAGAFITWLDKQAVVDTRRAIGTTGYCMGGPIVFRTAASVPGRVGAAATFHGGGLVTETADSPHLLIPKMKAGLLIAIAQNDDEKQPEAKAVLGDAFTAAGLKAEIEVYSDAMHGWCPPDSPVYNEIQAERAWSRLLDLFANNLA